jgi:hypothetical protein
MNACDMAKLLKPYGVKSVDVKIDGTNREGYRRDHLHETWIRYLPPAGGGIRLRTRDSASFAASRSTLRSSTPGSSITGRTRPHERQAGSAARL